MLEIDLYFRIAQDNTFEGSGGLLLSFPLQSGARDKTVPVGAPILKGWIPPLAPNSHLVMYEDGLGGLEVRNTAMRLNKIGGFLARMVRFAVVRVRGGMRGMISAWVERMCRMRS